ncbi:MAG: hypothetical protein O7I42_00395, partial [Alphaproteobacteria bacterium]|nr:hypothetical protein [Alphaproteobacteria bacterium]
MRIDSTFTVAECERYLAEFRLNDNEIILPTKARRAALGGEAAIWQLVTTWAVTRMPATLRLYAQQPDEVNEFVRRLHGLIAGLCADKAVSVKSGADLLPEVFRSALRRLEEMHGTKPANASRGPNFEIVCADHLNRGVPRQLYFKTADGEMKLKSESEFQSLARTAVKAA